jgi:hypothetical protein
MESSVLFEDTASISYVKVKYADNRYAFGGILLGIVIGFGFVDAIPAGLYVILIICPLILGLILGYDKVRFDCVNIETRGGKIISFAVSEGRGKDIMEQIEDAKRVWEEQKK